MSSRADKAAKQQKDRYHAILRELVKELPNKTCADCLGKGPRWASWSLGVFVCIRCAGIHRNLGVHLSKVKSVDLDSWNTQQIENMLKWGNKRAAEYFECYLPTDFTRPSSNHAVEAFIRNKYEKKQYIMKGGEPEPNPSSKLNMLKTDSTADKEKEKSTKRRERTEKKKEQKEEENTILKVAKQTAQEKPSVKSLSTPQPPQQHKSSSMNDLLSLDTPAPQQPAVVKPSASSNDLLFSTNDQQPAAPEMDLFGLSNTTNGTLASAENNVSPTQPQASEPQKSTKESILSLYGSSSSQLKPQYGVPGGVYMPQQQMFPNQMNQLNMQMQQMSTTQQPTNYNQFNMQYQQQQPNQTPQFQQKQQFQQFQQPNQQFQQPNQQFQQSNQQFQQKQNFQQSNQQQFQPNQQFQQPNQQFQQFNNFSQANQFTNQQASSATSSANSFPNQSAFNGFGGITNKNAFATTNQNGFPQQNRYAAPTNQLSQNQNFGAQQNGCLMQQNGWSQQTQQPSNTGQTMNNLLWS